MKDKKKETIKTLEKYISGLNKEIMTHEDRIESRRARVRQLHEAKSLYIYLISVLKEKK